MISSGWREKRKIIKSKNVILYYSKYLLDPEGCIEFVMKSLRNSDKSIDVEEKSKFVNIHISKASNYDFLDCNIYIEGNCFHMEDFGNLDTIRNCTFDGCNIVSAYEDNIQFRYCVFDDSNMDLCVEHLDFSQCVIKKLYIYNSLVQHAKMINDELSFNYHSDNRMPTNIGHMTVEGEVDWVWFHHHKRIIMKKLELNSDTDIDLAVEDSDFIPTVIKNGNLIITNGKYTIHDYAEEREGE